MKTVKMNTILDLLDYYWEICDEDVDAGNRLICTLEDLLPFGCERDHDEWLDITSSGTADQFIDVTYNVLWEAALRDYRFIRSAFSHAEFTEWNVDFPRMQTVSTIRWDNDAKKPVATILVNCPFIGYDHIDEWVFQGCSFEDFNDDVIQDLTRKMKQIARRLGKEFNND